MRRDASPRVLCPLLLGRHRLSATIGRWQLGDHQSTSAESQLHELRGISEYWCVAANLLYWFELISIRFQWELTHISLDLSLWIYASTKLSCILLGRTNATPNPVSNIETTWSANKSWRRGTGYPALDDVWGRNHESMVNTPEKTINSRPKPITTTNNNHHVSPDIPTHDVDTSFCVWQTEKW